MTEKQRIEAQIRQVIAAEASAILLSDKLFSPGGLFNQLARTEEERRVVVQSSLFKEAQERLATLRRHEAAEFVRIVEKAQAAVPDGDFLLKLGRAARP